MHSNPTCEMGFHEAWIWLSKTNKQESRQLFHMDAATNVYRSLTPTGSERQRRKIFKGKFPPIDRRCMKNACCLILTHHFMWEEDVPTNKRLTCSGRATSCGVTSGVLLPSSLFLPLWAFPLSSWSSASLVTQRGAVLTSQPLCNSVSNLWAGRGEVEGLFLATAQRNCVVQACTSVLRESVRVCVCVCLDWK